MTGLAHRPGKEAAVEQMQNSVFYAADILVDGQPPVGDRRDSRQDCRHQEGAVGGDKRNCKQQRRQTRSS